MRREERILPQVARLRLREQVRRVDRGEYGEWQAGRNEDPLPAGALGREAREKMRSQDDGVSGDDERATHEPASPLRAREDQIEALRVVEVGDENQTGDGQECPRDDGRGQAPERARVGERSDENQQQRHQVGAGRDPFGPRVERKPPVPRRAMGHVVGEHGGGRAVGLARVARGHLMRQRALLAPHEDSALRTPRGDRVERRLVRSFVEELRARVLFGAAHGDRLASDDLRDLRARIVQVADENRLHRTHHHARGLEADVDPLRAEVALLRGVVLRVDEDRIVRTGRDAGLAADADRFVEIDDAVRSLVHRRRRTSVGARWIFALIAARDLKRAAHVRKDADVGILHVGAVHGERHLVFRLAGRGAGVATDAAAVVDDFRPAHRRRGCRGDGRLNRHRGIVPRRTSDRSSRAVRPSDWRRARSRGR